MPIKKFDIGEALRFGWDKAKKHFWFFLAVLAGIVVCYIVVSIISGPQPNRPVYAPGIGISQYGNGQFGPAVPVTSSAQPPSARNILGSLLSFILSVFISVGMIRISLKILDDVRGTWRDFLPGMKMFWSMLAGNILYGLLVFAGFILLIIPGIIWAIKYRFYAYFIVDKDMGPIAALKASGQATKGEKWHLFLLGLASSGVVILGLIVLVIGLLWAIPAVIVAMAYVYKKLSAAGPEASPEPVAQPVTPAATPV